MDKEDRLTNKIGDIVLPTKGSCEYIISAQMEPSNIGEIMTRLAQYEETGVSPKEIKGMLNTNWNKYEVWSAISTLSSWRGTYNIFRSRRQRWKYHVCSMAIRALREVVGEPIIQDWEEATEENG